MSSSNIPTRVDGVDVRGPRFVAWITTAVLLVILIVSAFSPAAAAIILSLQAVVFALGAGGGPRRNPYGMLFATFVAPRLGPVREREPVPPLRFAQLVGFVFATFGIAGFSVGSVVVGVVATSFALVAALLNAAFGICLGCELYPLVARLRRTPRPA
ncbi:DUF4395 domain-containing protein [Mycobacterium simiae]|uniref:DUF4395 domain-containing protein n=1 Tax=Mycobacterium simiae TaxID=1784 RepID=A0A5B1BV48_MYCSI|nr:DUF4395 domain-containing protein [Mycobacterium simiae]KAA1251852.1 DUF4395 domain-containing protein [Mycobacterium simiae]